MYQFDVDKRLGEKYREIVEHLQTALETVKSDEADFKSVTDLLNKMFQSLREKKSDISGRLVLLGRCLGRRD